MGAALRRSAYSPNIKERRDYSCAVFDARGRVVAMGDHMPVHLGAMPMSVAAARAAFPRLGRGDVIVLNDPFEGGTHLPDITLVSAVRPPRGRTIGWLAVRAHHADVGGIAPGSMPLAREIYQEGLRLPPVRLMTRGRRLEDVWRIVRANVRTPDERDGDLAAQLAALVAGERRLLEMIDARGAAEVRRAMNALIQYADAIVRQGIARIPDGEYSAEDVLDGNGFDPGPLRIRVTMRVHGDELTVDFTGTAAQTGGGVNAVDAITTSATRYVVRCIIEALLGQPLPAGGGEMSALHFILPTGSLVAAVPPASVAAGNVETSQRITDVLLAACAHALPDLAPAQSQGTMNNLAVGGSDPRTGAPFAYYETMAGGMGGSPVSAGLSGVHVHMSNSLNTPIEALEHAYPMRIVHYALRRGSGGAGLHAGGEGVRRDLQLLTDAEISLLTERRERGPRGMNGGADGAPGINTLIDGDTIRTLPGKATLRVRKGSIIRIESPGGGGWGAPPRNDDAGAKRPGVNRSAPA
ncbi:MAG: hydantoinase B/oxoprolinase family protein [Gemmatimonadetes bacterium]|nr:hydantoinase B/oxoprolinase family protein [Gemmatimonadota bacterium]